MTPENPERKRYPGIKPFNMDEHAIFFGRDAAKQSLYELVGVEKTVLLYSKSGLGKTSLINAGLIPELKNDKNRKYQPYCFRFNVFTEKNHVRPKERIIGMLKNEPSATLLQDQLPELYENNLMFWIKSLQFTDPGQIQVLIFDQFEELFTYPQEQISELKKELHELLYMKFSSHYRDNILLLSDRKQNHISEEQVEVLSAPVNIRLVFSIRSDKLSLMNLLTDYLPNLLRVFFELKPLTVDQEAVEAIEGPAGADGDFDCPKFQFDPETTKTILNELSRQGKQPIETFQLQLVCQDVENKILANEIRGDHGNIIVYPKDLDNIPEIIKNFIERILSGIQTKSEDERTNLRKLLEEKFIYHPEKRRIPVLKGVIDDYISEETLASLEKTHLIRSELYQDTYTYELSHDNLVEPFLISFQKRKTEEEQALKEEEERKRREEEEMRNKALRDRNKIIFVSVAALICLGFGVFGFISMNRANEESAKFKIANDSLIIEKRHRDSLEMKLAGQSRIIQAQRLINDAKSYLIYGYRQDARRYADSAKKIDPNNREADSLIKLYKNQ